MKSKRSEFIVVTDDNIHIEMHFFSDGTKGAIIQCEQKHIDELYKQSKRKMPKKLKKYGKFVHLSPEISFFIKKTE